MTEYRTAPAAQDRSEDAFGAAERARREAIAAELTEARDRQRPVPRAEVLRARDEGRS